jgi:glycosyltransferase involved in cell wall biosynthesis
MTNRNPKVSVCIPNYNYDRFIGQAIQSVLDQTFADFELIIVDDCSTDNSVPVIKSFSDERVKFYQNEKNIGRVKNINKCLSLASGEYVTLLPSDDIYLPTSLEKRVEILDSNPAVGLVYSSAGVIDEDGVVIKEYCPYSQDYIRKGEEEFKRLIFANHISVLTAMVRRECYTSLGVFNEAVTGGADWEMWLRISLNNYDIAFITEVLAYDRMHSGNVSTYHFLTNLRGMNTYRVVKTVFSNLLPEKKHLSYLEPEVVKALARSMLASASGNLVKGQSSLARRNIGLAIAMDDSIIKDWRTYVIFIATFTGICIPFLKRALPDIVKRTIYRAGLKMLVDEKN